MQICKQSNLQRLLSLSIVQVFKPKVASWDLFRTCDHLCHDLSSHQPLRCLEMFLFLVFIHIYKHYFHTILTAHVLQNGLWIFICCLSALTLL